MPNYCQPFLEFSTDLLSDTTPTYTDGTSYLKDATWFSGIQRDLDQPQAGGAVFTLRNKNRDWEPEFTTGRFYPNVVPLRRFRWSITADGVTYPQGVFYAVSYQVVYPDPGSTESDVVVTCVDGFGLLSLATLPALDPPTAETYGDVLLFDNPVAVFPLDEGVGGAMTALAGSEGKYKGTVDHVTPGPVLGAGGYAASFANGASYGRSALDDVNVFQDSGAFTVEVVATTPATLGRLVNGPWRTAAAQHVFELLNGQVSVVTTAGVTTLTAGAPTSGTHHHALVWDGANITYYVDGVSTLTGATTGQLATADAGEFLYVAAGGHGDVNSGGMFTYSYAAFYDYALPPSRIQSHVTAALSRGYPQTTAGARIATLATNPLWSTASIPAGAIQVTPRMQTGQPAIDEILATVQAETPFGLFFFNDAGNPAYTPWDAAITTSATLGENEVQYDDLGVTYDDQLFNTSTVTRDGGLAQTATDTASVNAYGARGHDETGLILQNDSDAKMIAQAFVDQYGDPMYRIDSITLNGAQQNRRTQILTREIGDTIRIKRRGAGGTANPDVIARIIGKSKHLDVNRHLTNSWSIARGFAAATQVNHLGVTGYAELNTTFILGR